ncbi:MAG: histidine phosphatase family protein [Puniceicoccales bacterium]|jgi:phosphohistidine phosphatase|nr:histidine phosphatase family protein [Puniceicoccales bacterium]
MKRLYVVRHAQAVVDNDTPDYDRALSKDGINEAQNVAYKLASTGMRPDLMITSGARRSLDTARIIREVFGLLSSAIQVHDELYLADADKIFEALTQIPDNKNSVMVISHNPGISRFLEDITGNDKVTMTTGSMAVVEIHAMHWSDIASRPHMGRQLIFFSPHSVTDHE